MNCDSVAKLIPLYFYGEVTSEEEDQVDQHLSECSACAARMEQQRALAVALDERQVEVPTALLEECREDLMAAIAGGAPRQVQPAKGPWTLFLEAMSVTFAGFGRLRQPATALLLIGLGYAAARFTGASPVAATPASDAVLSAVREVKAEPNGSVHIQYDETRRREVSGRLEDANIRSLLLTGAHDENAAVRLPSVGLLTGLADSPAVRESLLNSLVTDPNDGVRLEAVKALRPMAGDPQVLRTLSQVLLTDANPAVRMQVIDMIVTRRNDSVVGVLQNLMEREDNSGVRAKAYKALKDWNASIGTF